MDRVGAHQGKGLAMHELGRTAVRRPLEDLVLAGAAEGMGAGGSYTPLDSRAPASG